jgi:hypothetical protein
MERPCVDPLFRFILSPQSPPHTMLPHPVSRADHWLVFVALTALFVLGLLALGLLAAGGWPGRALWRGDWAVH